MSDMVLFTSENNIANQSVDTSFFIVKKSYDQLSGFSNTKRLFLS